jgi:hypothetical protein
MSTFTGKLGTKFSKLEFLKLAAIPIIAPPTPTAVALITVPPIRLLRDDWQDPQMLGEELQTYFGSIPTLASHRGAVAAINWADLQSAAQQIVSVLQSSGKPSFQNLAGRLQREQWRDGRSLSEELWTVFQTIFKSGATS